MTTRQQRTHCARKIMVSNTRAEDRQWPIVTDFSISLTRILHRPEYSAQCGSADWQGKVDWKLPSGENYKKYKAFKITTKVGASWSD